MQRLKIFLIAGEASGDLLGAELIKEISKYREVELVGVGGEKLAKYGLDSLIQIEKLSVMGLFEVLPRIKEMLGYINYIAQKIEAEKPDLVITIDSPDFCFRVIKKIAKEKLAKTKFVHYVAPTVWAYRAKRAAKIAKLYDLLLVILPFEPRYFTEYGLQTKFIGHPIFSKHNQNLLKPQPFDFSNKKYLLVTPGSRRGEILRHLPIFLQVLKKIRKDYPEMQFLFFANSYNLEFLEDNIAAKIDNYRIVTDAEEKTKLMQEVSFALSKSGTNTMESAFYNICQVICYKVNFLTYKILKRIVKIKFANLINIAAEQEIIPELIQKDCNVENIYKKLSFLLADEAAAKNQIKQVKHMLFSFSNNKDILAAEYAAEEVLAIIE